MPRVPTYDNVTVQDNALPGSMASSIVSPDLLDAGAAKMIATGKDIEAAGDKINAIAIQAIHQQDLRDVNTASATLGKAQQDYHMDAVKNRTGAQADGLTADFDKWQAKQVEEISKTLKSPGQIEAFQTQAGRSGLSVRAGLGSFQVGEQKKAGVDAFNADVKAAVNLGAIAVGDDAAMVQRDLIVQKTLAFAAGQRMDKNATTNLMDDTLTAFHKQRIEQLAVSNPNDAARYFKEHEKEIAGSQRAEVGKFATQATAVSLGSNKSAEVWSMMGPKSASDPINIFDMEERIRKDLNGNDAAIDAGIKGIRERDAAMKSQLSQQSTKMQADVARLVMGGKSGTALQADPQFIALLQADPKAATAMAEHADNRVNMLINRGAALEARADAKEIREANRLTRSTNAAFFQYSNPDTVVAMSRDQITALLPVMGAQHTQVLLNMKDSFEKSADKLATARLDENTFKALAIGAGMNPDKKGLTEVDKDRFVQIKNAINLSLEQAQDQKGRPLTVEDRRKIAQQAFDDKVRTPGFIYGWDVVPAGALLPKELDKAVQLDSTKSAYIPVKTPGGRVVTVRRSEIPAAFEDEASRQLKGDGKKGTDAEIAELWILNKSEWRGDVK